MKTSTIFLLCFLWVLISNAQNNPPVAENDTAQAISQNIVLINYLANDSDPDGNSIHLSYLGTPRHGSADTINGMLSYKSSNYVGLDSLKYKIKDDGTPPASSPFAWIYIQVQENPDVPVAMSDTFELFQLIPVSVELLSNDFDPNGDQLKIHEIVSVYQCDVSINEDSTSVTVIPDINGSIGFFKYNIKESNTPQGYVSYDTRDFIYIVENPDLPVTHDDFVNATGGIPVQIDVLNNDLDPQGETIGIKNFTQPLNGFVNQEGTHLVYTSNTSFTGTDSFRYSIMELEDTNIYSHSAQVYVQVSKNPDCPVGVPDLASGTTGIPMTIAVLGNDTDINGDPIGLMDVKSYSNASVSIDGDLINYKSSPLSIGVDTLFYRILQVNDSSYYSEWTKVTITLADNPDLPLAVDDYATTYNGIPVTVYPVYNDILNSADSLDLFQVSGGSSSGVIRDLTDSSFTFIPFCNSIGTAEVHYVIMGDDNLSLLAAGKVFIDITSTHYYDSLEINNINAGINADGVLFSFIQEIPGEGKKGEIEPHFRFPKGGMKNTVFTNSLWVGGRDNNDSLHLSGERYKQVGLDYQAGPIANNYGIDYYLKYGRTWKISKAEVEYHKNNFWKEEYQAVESINSWPGNGDVTNGEAQQLAPYKDINQDGNYNPAEGDYPLIRGDQTVFIIYNDDLEHTESQGTRLKLEIHAMIYGYDAPDDSALNNTVFVHYDLINRSSEIYYETYAGVFTDIDIGYAWDDYIGCNVERGSFYGYNGYDQDGNGEPEAYGDNPPAQSVTILAGPYLDSDGADNPAGGCDESINGLNFGNGLSDDERYGLSKFIYFNNTSSNPATTDPVVAIEYYYYLQGIWKDQSPMYYGGNAHQSTGTVGPECRFMFPGSSDPMNWGTSCEFPNNGYNQNGKFWTEEEAGNNPADRRGLGVTGPFTFKPGDVQEIELAFCAANGWGGPLSSLNQLFENIDSLIQAVDHGEIIIPNNGLSINENNRNKDLLQIFPNPSESIIYIRPPFEDKYFLEYYIYNLTGTCCLYGSSSLAEDIKISVEKLVSGFYLVILKSDKDVAMGKFIKL